MGVLFFICCLTMPEGPLAMPERWQGHCKWSRGHCKTTNTCREMEIGNVAFSFNMGRAYASSNSLIVLLRAITQREVISCLVLSRQTLISVRGRRGDRERWTNRACRSCTLSSCRRTFQLIVEINTVVSPSN